MMPVLIQGPKQPGNDIDVYLRPLVEKLLQLWREEGIRMWDEHEQKEFKVWSKYIWLESVWGAEHQS